MSQISNKVWWQGIAKTSSLIGLSKVIGFIRDLLIAAYLGTSRAADAFNYAYLFTGNIFILLGGLNGPLHSAVVSTLSKIRKDCFASKSEETHVINGFLSQVFFRASLVFVFIGFVVWIGSPYILKHLFASQQSLITETSKQLNLMLPVLALTGLIGLLFGAVSFYGDYFWPSVSPLISSLVLIFLIYFGYQHFGPLVLAIGTSLGAALQAVVQFIDLKKYSFKWQFVSPQSQYLTYFSGLLFPALLSSSIGSLNVYVDSFFCASLEQGSWTAILTGNRLIQLPFGILVGSSLVSFLPRISAFDAHSKDFAENLNREISNLLFLMIPTTALLFALSEPLIKLLFERGEFNQHSTHLVNLVILGLAGSLITSLPREIYTRAFYAIGDSKFPMLVSGFSIIINALLDCFLGARFQVAGIALSTTLTALINSLLLIYMLHSRIKLELFNWHSNFKQLACGVGIYFIVKYSFKALYKVFQQHFATFHLPLFNLQIALALLISALIGLSIFVLVMRPDLLKRFLPKAMKH